MILILCVMVMLFSSQFQMVDGQQCSSFYSCSSCTNQTGCGWCGSGICLSGTSSGPINASCTGWVYTSIQCIDPCFISTNCSTCNLQTGCGWCGDTTMCMSGTGYGPTNAFNCQSWYWAGCSSAGISGCGKLADCSTCAGTTGCGWCPSIGCGYGSSAGPSYGTCSNWLYYSCSTTTPTPTPTSTLHSSLSSSHTFSVVVLLIGLLGAIIEACIVQS